MTKKKRDLEALETRFLPVEDREDVDQKYEAIVAYCQHFNTTFRDGEFPIDNHPKKKDSKLKRALRFISGGYEPDVKWTRQTEYRKCSYSRNINLNDFHYVPVYKQSEDWRILDNPLLENLAQSAVGDCGLIAVMGSLVEFPEVLSALFPRKELSEYGVYEVRLCVFGVWKSVLVDDWFMTRNNNWRVAFFWGNQLWPSLIEKALAKVYGGYFHLIAITSVNSFQTLTGHPATRHCMSEMTADQIWEILIEAKSVRYPMCASSMQKQSKIMKQLGVRPHHALSLIDVKVWRGCRLVRLRDNRGYKEWEAKWTFVNDSGKVLNEEERNALHGAKGRIIGTRWLELKHFRQCFDFIDVCHLRPSWTSITVQTVVGGTIDNRTKAIQLIAPDTTEMCFSAENPTDHKHLYATLFCLRRFDESTGDVGDIVDCFYIYNYKVPCTHDVRLEPGTYLVMATYFSSWKCERNIVIHSSKPVHARLVPLNPTVLTDSFQQFVRSVGKEMTLNGQDAHPKVSIKKCWISNHLFVMMAENYSEDEHLHVRVYFKYRGRRFHRQNNSIPPKRKDPTQQVDVVSPMSRQIILTQCMFAADKMMDESDIRVEYHLSSSNVARVWRMKTRHYPKVYTGMYVYYTFRILENE